MKAVVVNPAVLSAQTSLENIFKCLDEKKSFRLEAGAGSGKTHSLVKSLSYIIDKQGQEIIRHRQQVACITYTNVATNEIRRRTDGHPAVLASTIHAFFWSLIKDLQPYLRAVLPTLQNWEVRLQEGGGIEGREIIYDFGYPSAKKEDKKISLHHNDVLHFTVQLLGESKFRRLLTARFPILFIDEYQDTDTAFMDSVKLNLLDAKEGPLIGLFGDHWQTIYDGCGKVESNELTPIEQKSNFRSVKTIVDVLNRMRPELPQNVVDPESTGFVGLYHTNDWSGIRRDDSPFKEDLPAKVAHEHLLALKDALIPLGWDFSPGTTKILMLTHNVLAHEQGYDGIANIFKGRNDRFARKEDAHIKFFADVLEPVCDAYERKRFGEMFAALDTETPSVRKHEDKVSWAKDMDALLHLRGTGTIGQVIDHLKLTKRPRLSDAVERRELAFLNYVQPEGADLDNEISTLQQLRNVPYKQMTSLAIFLNDKTLFSTKHGVKGAEYENVLVVAGRGWNNYNFNQMLEWVVKLPADKQKSFERNRNLFYVACSRPKTRLAVLFTQKLSDKAMGTLNAWFTPANVHSLVVQAPAGKTDID